VIRLRSTFLAVPGFLLSRVRLLVRSSLGLPEVLPYFFCARGGAAFSFDSSEDRS